MRFNGLKFERFYLLNSVPSINTLSKIENFEILKKKAMFYVRKKSTLITTST